MKKIGFTLSAILSEIGCICLFITAFFDKTIPIIGKMASQLSDTKQYGDLMYLVDYKINYSISILMIITGIILAILFYRREE